MASAPSLGEVALDTLIPLNQDIVLYVLDYPIGEAEDGSMEALALVVMKRAGGALVAIPEGFLPPEELVEGNSTPGGHIGPSTVLEVPAVLWEDNREVPIGVQVQVRVVDMDPDLLTSLRGAEEAEGIAMNFAEDDPLAIPSPAELTAKTFAWLQEKGGQMEGDYTPEQTAESGDLAYQLPKASPKPKPKAGGVATGSGEKPKPKRQTTTSLAASVQGLLDVLPTLTDQMKVMAERQTQMEEKLAQNNTASLLSRPLTQTVGFPQAGVSMVAKEFRSPPRTQANLPDPMPLEVQELGKEKPQSQDTQLDLAKAVMAQSAALTTLVAQIASGSQDPMQDLTGAPAGSRGAQGRARLQMELAQQKGSFFHSVVMQMARRMSPTSNPDLPYGQLLASGITGGRYLERFGGYGRHRELGLIQHQLMVMMDFEMAGNRGALQDALALLIVMVEQACLDNGKFDLAQLPTLQEEPPAGVFTNRQLSQLSRARSFAPLADQKWVTVALAFLKELDTISAKRAEIVGGASGSGIGSGKGDPPKPKPSPKKKGRGKGDRNMAEEEENA